MKYMLWHFCNTMYTQVKFIVKIWTSWFSHGICWKMSVTGLTLMTAVPLYYIVLEKKKVMTPMWHH